MQRNKKMKKKRKSLSNNLIKKQDRKIKKGKAY